MGCEREQHLAPWYRPLPGWGQAAPSRLRKLCQPATTGRVWLLLGLSLWRRGLFGFSCVHARTLGLAFLPPTLEARVDRSEPKRAQRKATINSAATQASFLALQRRVMTGLGRQLLTATGDTRRPVILQPSAMSHVPNAKCHAQVSQHNLQLSEPSSAGRVSLVMGPVS